VGFCPYTYRVRIRVRLFASFREAVGQTELNVEAPDGATVGRIVEGLRAEHPGLRPAGEQAMLAVNQEYVGAEYRLRDGDELALIPPVSGGGTRDA
jgi:molybdopterin synthase catalytic subunit